MTNEYGEYQWTDASGNVVIPRSQRETIKQEIAVVAERMGLAVAVDDVMTCLEGATIPPADGGDARVHAIRSAILIVLGNYMTMTTEGAAKLTARLQQQGGLPMWTVYERPEDYPGGFIARLFLTLPGVQATRHVLIGETLNAVRSRLPLGLACMQRAEDDDPKVVETWL